MFAARTGPKLCLTIQKILFGADLELGYMSVDGFSLSKSVYSGAEPLFFDSPLLTETASGGEGIRFNYISRFNSAEVNLRYGLGTILSLVGGFRYLDLHEQIDGTLLGAGPTDTRFITSNTDNHLYGFQLGAEAGFPIGKFHVAGIAKAGAFSNQSDLSLYGSDGTQHVGGIKGQLAFLGEADVIGSYCISDNIALRLGYQVMWLQGVALRPINSMWRAASIRRVGIPTPRAACSTTARSWAWKSAFDAWFECRGDS